MKKYTHAWLAMMAMKRIEKTTIPERQRDDAKALIKWFKDYRDFVISGSWYPDSVIKDMGTSHILKYEKLKSMDEDFACNRFRTMPETLKMYQLGLKSDMYGQPYRISMGNLCDRCESFTESLIDSFKILYSESKGSPIVPSANHIAMRFFILSHYIADCHMPLHCDARSFGPKEEKKKNVHTFIEEEWEKQISESYRIDEDNNRFLYDTEGYPAVSETGLTDMVRDIEQELKTREFIWKWGKKKDVDNTWDYMSGISGYSYLMAYRLIPDDQYTPEQITPEVYQTMPAYTEHFEEYSKIILMDAIESIAKVWLHAWVRYRGWWRDHELSELKAKADATLDSYENAQKVIAENPVEIEKLEARIEKQKITVQNKTEELKKAEAKGKDTTKKAEELAVSTNFLAEMEDRLTGKKEALEYAQKVLESLLHAKETAADIYRETNDKYSRYDDPNNGI